MNILEKNNKKKLYLIILDLIVTFILLLGLLTLYLHTRQLPYAILLACLAVFSLLRMLGRNLGQDSNPQYYTQERERLKLLSQGTKGVRRYIEEEEQVTNELTAISPLIYALLNLTSAYLLNAEPEKAAKTLSRLDRLDLSPTMQTLRDLYTLDIALQLNDHTRVESVYAIARTSVSASQNTQIQGKFALMELRYLVYSERYEEVLSKISALPENFSDDIGKSLINVLKCVCLMKCGRSEEISDPIEDSKMLPFIRNIKCSSKK